MKNFFLQFCTNNKFQHNKAQITALDLIISFYKKNSIFKNKFFNLFFKSNKKLGFYLYGDVGVGKTMLLNFFFENLKIDFALSHSILL